MTYWTFKNDSVKIEFRSCHFSIQNPPWFPMVITIKDQTLKLDCRSWYAVVPKICPHLPLGHVCPLPSCHIDLVFPKTRQLGPAFGLYSLWLECSSPDSHMLCFLTSLRSLIRISCLLTNASKNFNWLLLSKEINMSRYFFIPPLGISDFFIIHFYTPPELRFWKETMFHHLNELMRDFGRQKTIIFLWLLYVAISISPPGPICQLPGNPKVIW